jgi:hypothetical protein
MALDVEAVHEAGGETPFRRWLAVLVGAAALIAALLATLEMDAGKQEERALLMASRLSVRIFEGTAGGSPRFSFQVNSLQRAIQLALGATALQLAGLQHPDAAEGVDARAAPDLAASERLVSIVEEMARVPAEATGVDPVARDIAGKEPGDLASVVAEQNAQVDLADRFGERSNRAIFALSLLALGAVLVGLGGVLGDSRPGRVTLAAATVALSAALLWGSSGLLI